jgi:hypothetical protein
MRRGGLALVAILVLGSLTKLFLPSTGPSTAGPENAGAGIPAKAAAAGQEPNSAKPSKSSDWYPTQVREKIRDFFGEEYGPELDPYEGKANGKDASARGFDIDHACASVERWCVPPDIKDKIRFVIATTPDPVHSHLSLFFDRSIDAIQQGATSQGFLFDRAIMPWQYLDVPTLQVTDDDKFLQYVRESYPGLMIFRGKPNQAPLFIFVVAETPTAGINKEQFINAVQMIHEIREGKDSVKPEQAVDFSVLGPTFSGSLYSLQVLLQQYLKDYPLPDNSARVFPVYSTVMGTQAIQDFSDFNRDKHLPVRMAVFLEDGKAALDALLAYTTGEGALGYRSSEIAVLNEDDTSYGTSGTKPDSASNALDKDKDKKDKDKDVLTLFFPRGISQFRSAYSKDLQSQAQSADANQAQRRNLRLDLEVTGSDDDNVAPYAAAQTALSQEAIMLGIVSELRQGSSKFVLIRATDPLDELFLSRYLSSQYPDARLVVPTPDLLFAREEGGVLDGTMGLNTYPVWPPYANPLCPTLTGGFPIFPAATSAGLYNATVALLSEPIKEGQPPAQDRAPAAAAAKPSSCALSPNLWLTIVSRNSIYPIKVLSPGASLFFPTSNQASPEEHGNRRWKIQSPWAILCVLVLALFVNHVRCSWKPSTLRYWQTAKQLPDPGLSSRGRSWILWIGSVALAGMPVIFISSLTPLPGKWGDSTTSIAAFLLWICLVCFTGFIVQDFWRARKERMLAGSFLALTVSFTWAAKTYASQSSYGYWNSEQMVLWQQRVIDLASHVSPATPLLLLLAAFYAWFWFSLKSESLTDWRTPQLPQQDEVPSNYDQLSERMAQPIRNVMKTFGPPLWVPGVPIGLVFVLVMRGLKTGPSGIAVRSLEGTHFDILYSILLSLALLLLTATLIRIVAVWWQLQPMLLALDRPGMRQALKRLKGFEWDVIWNPLGSMRDEVRRLYLKQIHVVERLKESLGGADSPVSTDVAAEAKESCGKILAARQEIHALIDAKMPPGSENAQKFIRAFMHMQRGLAHLAAVLCDQFLDPSWKALSADDAIEAPGEQTPDSPKTINTDAAIVTVRDFQAVIQKADDPPPPGLSTKSLLLAEEFVACVYSTFITIVLLRIRWMVFSSVMIYTAIVFSSTSYPFQPASNLRTLALSLFLLGAMVVGYVYEEMHHDPAVRNMTSTDPNKVDTAFWAKFATAGLLPLLGLLTSLFPQFGHLLYTIAAPILQATR